MFLFSTPQTTDAPAQSPVVSAIREGAEKTGAGFDYLLKTAQRESALAPEAKAKTSSATGLFQFIEQTWLAMVKQEGPKQGLSDYAGAITEGENGRLTVADPAAREKILQLRNDPQVASVMAGALTQKNRDQLVASLGRQPNAGELYMAHVLGARGASDLIQAAMSDPTRTAARDFPDAAGANRGIFYDKTGRARSVQEVYGVLAASHANTQLAATTSVTSEAVRSGGQGADRPAEIAAALAPGRARGLIGLFSTEGSREPVSKAVANLWTTPRTGEATRLASLDPSQRYFPRQTQNDASPVQASAAADTSVAPLAVMAPQAVMAPLPPSRPAALTQPANAPAASSQAASSQALSSQASSSSQAPTAQAAPAARARRAPLDLSAFMVPGGRS